jgi:hypothetical protein
MKSGASSAIGSLPFGNFMRMLLVSELLNKFSFEQPETKIELKHGHVKV